MEKAKLLLWIFFSTIIAACGGGGENSAGSSTGSAGVSAPLRVDASVVSSEGGKVSAPSETANTTSAMNATVSGGERGVRRAMTDQSESLPRMLPLQLIAPLTARVGVPLVGVSVSLLNTDTEAPDARLRLIIHYKDHGNAGAHSELSPDNVRVEVQEGGIWKPVLLGMVEDGVMGAIGTEGVAVHQERHKRGGFAIPAGFNKTWQLRVTFDLPGVYSFVTAVSPDNGSKHLAQPAHSNIEVQ